MAEGDPSATPDPTPQELAELEKPATVRPLPGLAKRAEFAKSTAEGWTTIKSDEEFAGLKPGTPFIDPKGVRRFKPLETEDDYWNVPEGQHFIDPQGVKRLRPTYDGVGVGTQTLFDMAQNDRERRKVLERAYPKGEIKDSPQGMYVEDAGVLRKPGRGIAGAVGHTAAEAAPFGGFLVGSMLGGGAGLFTGPAAPAAVPGGAIAGGIGGAMMGRSLNNFVLSIAGVHDRTFMEDIGSVGMEGAMVAGGEVVGRGVAAVAPTVARGAASLKERAAYAAAHFTGVHQTPDAARLAREISAEGTMVSPSRYMPEAPYLATVADVFDPKFRAQQVLRESARAHYERNAAAITDVLGIDAPEGGFTRATKGISVEKAGIAAQNRIATQLARSDAEVDAAIAGIEARAAGQEADIAGRKAAAEAELNRLNKLAETNRADADAAIQSGFHQIEREIEQGLRQSNVTSNSGDLWQATARAFRNINAAIKARAGLQYGRGDAVAGGYIPPQAELAGRAQALLNQLGPEFSNRYPHIAQQLRNLAGIYNEKGELVKEPVDLTLGQLRHLRSSLGQDVDWSDLAAGIREGAYKHFRNVADDIIHNPNLPDQAKRAVAFYDAGDKIYRKNMPIYNSATVKAVMRGIQSGFPADATELADTLIKEGFTKELAKVRRMVGPNLWASVAAADKRNMLNKAKTLEEGVFDAVKFAREIQARNRAGLLEPVHGRDGSAALVRQAQAIMDLEGEIPVQVRPGDSLTAVIERAQATANAAKAAAKADPLGVLDRELKAVRQEAQEAIGARLAAATEKEKIDPFAPLANPKIGAIEAAEEILKRPDLFIAAAARFGEDSEAWQLLRQAAVLRHLQRPIERLGGVASRAQRDISPEVWKLMFPGVTQEQATRLMRHMEFLLGPLPGVRGAGGSIAAQSRVLNPAGAATGLGKLAGPVKMVPGVNAGLRFTLTKAYQFMTWASANPATVQWLTKALESGDPGLRRQAWEVVARSAGKNAALQAQGEAVAARMAAGQPRAGGPLGGAAAVGIGPPELSGEPTE